MLDKEGVFTRIAARAGMVHLNPPETREQLTPRFGVFFDVLLMIMFLLLARKSPVLTFFFNFFVGISLISKKLKRKTSF